MKKVMVFIDFENFNIATLSYYRGMGKEAPRLDYSKIPKEIVKMIPGKNELVKTFLFAPKPDDFLMKDRKLKRQPTSGCLFVFIISDLLAIHQTVNGDLHIHCH